MYTNIYICIHIHIYIYIYIYDTPTNHEPTRVLNITWQLACNFRNVLPNCRYPGRQRDSMIHIRLFSG